MSRRKKSRHRHHDTPGIAPGTLTPANEHASTITVIAYNGEDMIERRLNGPDEIPPCLQQWPVTWINVDGLGSVDTLSQIGEIFELHPLALEDVLNVHHRAKAEDYDRQLFIVAHMLRLQEERLDVEQISMFIGRNYILTFQERPDGDVLEPVRNRLRRGKGRTIRKAGPDYLAYAILDATIDGYFPILEYFSDTISTLEDRVISKPDKSIIADTHRIKRELQTLRHATWPLREVIATLDNDHDLMNDDTKLYLRDCHDHVINVLDLLEMDRERASGLIDIYLSSINNQMNETMRVLTVIATIFIPLSFIASVYGMNFDTSISKFNMPELEWVYGYPFALGLMLTVALGLLVFFKRRGWIGLGHDGKDDRDT